jgi:hypothetical protein
MTPESRSKPIPASRPIPWLRIFLEGAVIVGSILLAFGIEAAWDSRQELEREGEYLEQLLADLYANRDVIANANRQQESQLHHARRVYPFVASGEWGDLDPASAVISSYLASPTPTPTWVNHTFEELRSTGSIGLIRDAGVRSGMLEYYRYLEAADHTYELMSTSYRNEIRERMDPDLQLAIRRDCSREVGAECTLDLGRWDIDGYVTWLGENPVLARGLRRVIVQWTRAEEEYLPGVGERTDAIIALIENS